MAKIYSKKVRNLWNLFLIVSIYIFVFQPITANSQPDSLYKYLGIAARNNPLVLQKFAEYQAALQKVPQAGSLSDPEFSLGVLLQPMELMEGYQVADLRLMQMFPWFGVLKAAKDEMSLMANAKFELFRDAKLQVFYEVQRNWYELYKIQKEINISEKNIEILKTIERLALVKFKFASSAGSVTNSTGPVSSAGQNNSAGSSVMQTIGNGQGNPGSSVSNQSASSMQSGSMSTSSGISGLADIYRIQIETGDLENNIELLKDQRNTISVRFNNSLNRPPDSPVYTPEKIDLDSLEYSLAAVSDSMLAKNPMLGMLDYEKQSIESRKKMVSRMGYPMVGIGVNYTVISKFPNAVTEMNGKDMIMPMVVVTLPIYRKKYNAMRNEAEFLSSATFQNYQATTNSLQADYYQAVQLYKDANRRVKLYKTQYELASKSLDLTLKSFTSSSSELTDVLRIRQQTLDYELKQVEASVDFNTAVAWLKRLGSLEKSGNK